MQQKQARQSEGFKGVQLKYTYYQLGKGNLDHFHNETEEKQNANLIRTLTLYVL